MPVRGGPKRCPYGRARLIALAATVLGACLLPAQRTSALRLPSEEPGLPVRVHVQWNQQYLSLAAKAPDFMVTGSSATPMSAPDQDDAIEFCFEMPTQHPPRPAYRLIISAAGGVTVLARDAGGHWRLDDSWVSGPRTIKYVVQVDGTLNDPTDEDVGFVVECAIPWEFLQGAPIDGPQIGFNVVCWMQGESEGLASWSPHVGERADVGESSRWGRMAVSTTATLAKAEGVSIPCPYVGSTPLIDGKLSAHEWLTASTLEFEKPKPVLVTPPPTPETGGAVGTLLAVYRYDWQWHSSRGGAPLWTPDGAPATADQPREGAGPWYSSERVAWHRAQLQEIQRAGIDIILPRYCGHEASRESWARAGLDYLTEALKTRRAKGQSYPLVGMLLATACLDGIDLTSDPGRGRLYGMIREFFLHVSPEFWAELPASSPGRAAGGVPVLLGEPNALGDWDGTFLQYCEQRFAEDFDGARLTWLGSSAWTTRGAAGFYAHVRLPETTGFTQEPSAGASAVALSPGYVPSPGTEGEIRPRREGRAYRGHWQRVLAAKPELVVIDSWNNFATATEIAPSRQYGVAYVDATKYFKARLGSQAPHQLRLKKRATPKVLRPGADYLVELLVENVGTQDISTGRRVTADCRIVRQSDRRVVQRKTAAQSVSILAGQTKRLPVVISTKDDDGRPLPPGDYVLSLALTKSKLPYFRSRWFGRTLAELTLPITVGEPPARGATVLSTSLPSAIERGATEQVVVRLRNDGAGTWQRGKVFLSYRWLLEQHSDDAGSPLAARLDPDRKASIRAELPAEVAPGEVVSVLIPVTAPNDSGWPEPTSARSQYGTRIQWELIEDTDARLPGVGAPMLEEAIQILPDDPGVVYESADPPAVMEAGQEVKLQLVLRNAGSRVWNADESSVRYRWHRWDGRPYPAGQLLKLPGDVQPGSTVRLEVPLQAPRMPGPYWLTWEAAVNGAAASECRSAPPVSPVTVRSANVRALDLSSFMNVIAVTTDSNRARADFDGSGRSLPAEWLPPDQSGGKDGLYPNAYYAPQGTDAVPFSFPDTSAGVGGAVACTGQSIPLGSEDVEGVYMLAASTAGLREAVFGLRHAAGQVDQLTVAVPPWTQPHQGTPVGAYAPFVRSLSGDDPATPAYLHLLRLAPSSPTATSLELPRAPEVKILAITVQTE